jgi:hypothetical protein
MKPPWGVRWARLDHTLKHKVGNVGHVFECEMARPGIFDGWADGRQIHHRAERRRGKVRWMSMSGWPADIPTKERKRKRRFDGRTSANRRQIHPRARRRGRFVRRAGAEGWRPRECRATPKRIETKVPCYRARGEWIGERTARCEIGLLVEVGAWCLFPPSLLPSFHVWRPTSTNRRNQRRPHPTHRSECDTAVIV